jgi:hypothetical protein
MIASLQEMPSEGCKVCAELMRKSMAAISAHAEARAKAARAFLSDSDANLSGSDANISDSDANLEAYARAVTELREAKANAMEEYQAHMLLHQVEDSDAASA